MSRKPSREPLSQQCTQVERFRDLARQLECDEDEKAFEEKVRKVATSKPPAKESGHDEE